MTALQPGVTVREELARAQTTASQTTTAFALVGTNRRGPVSPRRVTSWTQFTKVFGGFQGNHELPYSVFNFFANGGRELYVNRPSSSEWTTAQRTFSAPDEGGESLVVNAADPGEWANEIHVSFSEGIEDDTFDMTVFYGEEPRPATQVERFTQLSMDPDNSRFVEKIVNSPRTGSTFVRVSSSQGEGDPVPEMPAFITDEEAEVLSGGLDDASLSTDDWATAVSHYDVVTNPVAINLPGVSDVSILSSVIQYAQNREDVFVVIDPPKGMEPQEAVTWAQGVSGTSFAALYYPNVITSDPSSRSRTADRVASPGGAILGQYARFDERWGVFQAPAGMDSRLSNVIGLEFALDGNDLRDLTAGHVNPLRNMPGSGVTIHGARTLRITNDADRYIPVRRSLIYLNKSLQDVFQFAVFMANDEDTWASIRNAGGRFLGNFWRRGGLRGETANNAFYVKCDEELNDEANIEQGILEVEIGVALQRPAEFIVVRLRQWQGGASAAEEIASAS